LAPAERGEGGAGEGGAGEGGAAGGAAVAATPTPKQSVAATPEPGMAAVRALLGRCRLEGYSAVFEEQGYDDLEFLLTLDRAGWG